MCKFVLIMPLFMKIDHNEFLLIPNLALGSKDGGEEEEGEEEGEEEEEEGLANLRSISDL